MNSYLALKALHVLAAITSVGTMFSLPTLHWVMRHSSSEQRSVLVDAIDRQISISGWILVASGFWLTAMLGGWPLLRAPWLAGSIALIVVGLAWDGLSDRVLPTRMVRRTVVQAGIKGGLFLAVAALMVLKPV